MPLTASLVSSAQAQPQRHDSSAIRDIVFALCIMFVVVPLLARAAERPIDSREVTAVKSEASNKTAVRLNFGNVALECDRSSVHLSFSRQVGSRFAFETTTPLSLYILDKSGSPSWSSGEYTSIRQTGDSLVCTGEIHSKTGSVFAFTDIYSKTGTRNSFVISRQVEVARVGDDAGFLSRFSLHSSSNLASHDFFIPGIWYGNNELARRGAMGTSPNHDYFIIREDRMPLPLVMMRHKRQRGHNHTGSYRTQRFKLLAGLHRGAVIDERIQLAALGVFSRENTAVSLYYPAAEGERSYIRRSVRNRGNRGSGRWVERFHPVEQDVKHRYKVLVNLSEQHGFPVAMRHAWRVAYQNVRPPIVKADIPACYDASINLIADWSKTTNRAPGLPFRLRLPEGDLEDAEKVSYQMGFVGQQIPLAYHLLRYGLLNNAPKIRRKGEVMVDFWAANSPTDDGLPRTWFNTFPKPHWRRYNTYMRGASDGMVGALMAWDIMQKYGHSKPQWISFCTGFGNWLVKHQNDDGSWFREYHWDSTPAHRGKGNTTQPIPFLVDLWKATGNDEYRDGPMKAGEYCWREIHEEFSYVGGT